MIVSLLDREEPLAMTRLATGGDAHKVVADRLLARYRAASIAATRSLCKRALHAVNAAAPVARMIEMVRAA